MIEKENISKEFVNDLKQIISESKRKVVSSINYIMLQTYWTIGKRIVEEEQKGDVKAEYGSSLLKEIAIKKYYSKRRFKEEWKIEDSKIILNLQIF